MTTHTHIDTLNQSAWQLRRKDLAQAIELTSEAYHQAEALDYKQGLATSLGQLARFSHYNAHHETALDQVLEAIVLFEQAALQHLEPYLASLHTLAMVYGALGSYANALSTYLRLAQFAVETENADFEVIAQNGIGISYSRVGNHHEALRHFQQCLLICQATANRFMEGTVEENIANEFAFLGFYDEAIEHCNRALAIFTAQEEPWQTVSVTLSLGDIFIKCGQLDGAEILLRDILERAAQLPMYSQTSTQTAQLLLGRVNLASGNYDIALRHLQTAMQIAQEMGNKHRVYECHEQLAQLYKVQGDFETALAHYEQFHILREEVFSAENRTTINNLMVIYQTESMRRETELYKKLREQDRLYYEKMSQMRDDLIHSASHDLKNPLTNILTYAYLLRQNIAEDEQSLHYIGVIERQVDRMRELISDILELATIEAQLDTRNAPATIAPYLQEIVDEFRPLASQRKIDFKADLAVMGVAVVMNWGQMRRALHNLLSNALKYTASGGQVRLTAKLLGNELLISIRDSGGGIAPEDLPFIFEKFFRGKNYEQVEGTGLGLAIVHKIIDLHGGKIEVSSQLNQGSEFRILLPAKLESVVS